MNCDDMRELPLAEKEIVFSEWMSDWLISNNMEVKIIILCYSPLHACGNRWADILLRKHFIVLKCNWAAMQWIAKYIFGEIENALESQQRSAFPSAEDVWIRQIHCHYQITPKFGIIIFVLILYHTGLLISLNSYRYTVRCPPIFI